MLAGAVEASKESMEWLLNRRGTGNALCIITGGALEALEAFPGRYVVKLKNRKGFIKIALRNGYVSLDIITLIVIWKFDMLSAWEMCSSQAGGC